MLRTILADLTAASLLSGADASGAFRPGMRVLFQGDSITDGNRGRTADPNHILGHGYVLLIAAKYGALLPDRHLTFLNRGVSGNTVADLTHRWQADTLAFEPDLLSILIGINDANRGVPVEEFEKEYDDLLAATVKARPSLRLVLGEPFTLPVGKHKADWETWRADVARRQQAVARLADKVSRGVGSFSEAI